MLKRILILTCIYSSVCLQSFGQAKNTDILSDRDLRTYVNSFNAIDTEAVKNHISNAQSFNWLKENIPLFDCPDTLLEKTYYFRWWSFRKHLKQTPDGYVFTEFITPMKHGGKYNTISSGLGHHINEGRWLRNPDYINQYIKFWLYADKQTPKPHLHAFSSWLQHAVYDLYLVKKDKEFIKNILPALHDDYKLWEEEKMNADGSFWQYDVRDAMEESISGGRKEKNVRPTINSYMYGNAKAMVKLAAVAGADSLKEPYTQKAQFLKSVVQNRLWDDTASFFKVQYENGKLCNAREAIGFIPWYFNLPDDKKTYATQWNQLTDTMGFDAPWGITTAERRHPLFRTHGSGHGCEWDGAVWPYATTQTLKALSNVLTSYRNKGAMNKNIFYDELYTYAWSHQMNSKIYIGEYQDETTGEWLKGDNPRSTFYNHSGFADIIINDLIGIKGHEDDVLQVHPLIPQNKWDWFCIENVPYHGMLITVLWDKTGRHYHKGKGMQIMADGKQLYKGKKLKHIQVRL